MTKRQHIHRLFLIIAVTLVVGYSASVANSQSEPTPLLVSDIDWSPDGSQIAIGIGQWNGQYLQSCDITDILLVDTTSGQSTIFPRTDMLCSPSSLDFSQASTQILVASASTIETWDLITGARISAASMEGLFQSAAYSPNESEILVTLLPGVQLLDVSLENLTAWFPSPSANPNTAFIYSAWSPDGLHIASSMNDGSIYIWNANDTQIVATFQEHSAPVKRLEWNPVSNVIASGDDSGIIWIWDATTGQPIRQLSGHTGIVYDVAWHPDGQEFASAGEDDTLRVWNASTGAMTIVDSSRLFSAVAYSPDGTYLAYAGEYSLENPGIEIIPAPSVATPTPNFSPRFAWFLTQS